ncbi:acyltransferase family protein [Hymenobacter sedentarius]|uniref:acyltransferase family protein n=1 Tax=Hymenobacter sedentarius TaxID=1411621 RepID=UPI0012FD75B4|nr:acyltransferase [Hymenobacter sedentarius]
MHPSTTSQRSATYPALTGIRAVAAAMVFFFHYNPLRDAATGEGLRHYLYLFLTQWNAGVTLFFVLSGFLITHRYRDSLELSGPWLRRYLQNRLARIYPVYLLLTVATFALWHFVGEPFVVADWWYPLTALDKLVVMGMNLTLTRAYFEHVMFTGVLTAWSLTVEETFYLTAPLVLWSVRRRWQPLLLWAAVLPLLGLGLVLFWPASLKYYGFMETPAFLVNYTYFGHAAEFMAGVGLGMWVARRPELPRARLPLTLLGSLALVAVLAAGTQMGESPAARFALGLAIAGVVCVLFYGLLSEATLLQRALAWNLVQELGRASYVFYLLHVGVFMSVLDLAGVTTLGGRLLAVTAASIALYRFVEHPLHLRLKARRARVQMPVYTPV